MKTNEQAQKEVFKKVKKYASENEKLLKKYGLRTSLMVSFPRRKRVPMLSRFGLWLARVQGGVLDTRYDKK